MRSVEKSGFTTKLPLIEHTQQAVVESVFWSLRSVAVLQVVVAEAPTLALGHPQQVSVLSPSS